jgi:AcrR family transcriptional regulator
MYDNGVATSVDQVCAAAEVGKSQFYHYFKDKSDLVYAVIKLQADSVLRVQAPLLSDVHDLAGWRAWRNEIVQLQRHTDYWGACPLGALAVELSGRDRLARHTLTASFDHWEDQLGCALSRTVESGALRRDIDVMALATYLLAALQGGLVLCQARGDVRPLEVSLDGALAQLASHAA